ncbi:MAG: DEAD/DEAH box helicase family protein [Bacteroidaceae bacterium]|nr:DEAD/DEAH box helicase family protein [Bacteroidaceae bacterium]
MEKIAFQEKAVEELLEQFKRLWKNGSSMLDLTFKAPTGSGKTYMTEKFICELGNQPDWQQDVAFIWITFSDDLAMQSRDKFLDYFYPNVPGNLLTINDFNKGALRSKDVLFLNWQKLVSRKAEDRVNRRPEDERLRKEQGFYYEDVIEMTHAEGREIVLIIDESHKNVTIASMRDVIVPMNPRVIVKVSATPESEPSFSDVKNGKAGFVEVDKQDVIDAGMIKEQIVCQTDEDVRKNEGLDFDDALMQMAMDKREELKAQLESFGIDVNPLVLVQLPNDDADYKAQGVPTKEEKVLEYLQSKGVKKERIASWFDQKAKPEGLERNDSPYDFLLFKMAAGTGWDCPRAQVLVMFREIKSATFHTQTIGRIMRVPVRGRQGSEVFRTGYIYTNYKRNEVANADYGKDMNKPKLLVAKNRKGKEFVLDQQLKTEYIPRADYGDLGRFDVLQRHLCQSFDGYFDLTIDDHFEKREQKFHEKRFFPNIKLTNEIIINAKISDIDQLQTQLAMNGADAQVEASRNDVEKTFTLLCAQLLKEQDDEEAKVSNISRSWSPLKSAIRKWLKRTFVEYSDDECYRIFINDIQKDANSALRGALTQTLKTYRPNLMEQLRLRREQALKSETSPFKVLETYAYTDDYEAHEMERCILSPFYLRKEYNGKKTEWTFAQYLDALPEVEWWLKNGDSGKDYLSIRYTDSQTGELSLFYPDWIVRLTNGVIGIFDTKGGITATANDTKDKAEELQRRIKYLNSLTREQRYVGGIVRFANGKWYANNSQKYTCNPMNTDGWCLLEDLLV